MDNEELKRRLLAIGEERANTRGDWIYETHIVPLLAELDRPRERVVMALLSEAEVFHLIDRAIERAGSQIAFARQCGVSKQTVNDMAMRRKPPSPNIVSFLGLKRERGYSFKEREET